MQGRREYGARGALRLGVILVISMGLAAGSFLLGRHIQTPAQAVAEAQPPGPTLLTAVVEERELYDTVTFRADVELDESFSIDIAYSEPIPIVTELAIAQGETVTEGDTLIEVSGVKRFVLQGPLPPFRDLTPGLRGPDVEQLQSSLQRLGYPVGQVGILDWPTERALRTFFRDRGVVLEINQELGGAVVDHEWLIYLPELPSRLDRTSLQPGVDLRKASVPMLSFSKGSLRATATMEAGSAADLNRGQVVDVSGGTTTVTAAIESLMASQDEPSSVIVNLRFLDDPPPDWRGTNVRVRAVLQQTEGAVLTVPVSAVYGNGEGAPYLRILNEDGSVTRLGVEIGLSAGGYVQILQAHGSPRLGDRVVVGNAGT